MKEPEDCMAGAEREARALMGSGEAGDAQAASSGKAGGGGKGGDGGALRGAAAGGGCHALASCSSRIWFWSCWIFRGSLWGVGGERKATPSERELEGMFTWGSEVNLGAKLLTYASSKGSPE